MRLALKHQIIIAPVTVLLLMTLLLGFLQYAYWDLSVKRDEARKIRSTFIALAEADLAARRMQGLTLHLKEHGVVDVERLEEMTELYFHLRNATERIIELMPIGDDRRIMLQQRVAELDPSQGFDTERYLEALSMLGPQFSALAELTQKQRARIQDVHGEDIEELVARTAFISILVLGTAILLGIFLSFTFARRILRRMQILSDAAGRIAGGELVPPPPPEKVNDELDELTLSINRMTDQLIRVVGAEKLLEGAEEERRRIAMDIHDQTLADLSVVLRGIQELKSLPACRMEADVLEGELQRAMTNLREVMDNLHPQTLDILGLGAALQSHLERHLDKEALPEYHYYISPEAEAVEHPRIISLTLYRIAVEAIHNVIKHSRASRYEVNLDRRRDEFLLVVEDNGVGFDPAAVSGRGGRGLNNMIERAHAIGAKVSWKASRFTTGTRFELILPLSAGRAEEQSPWNR